ncbi:MmcQ/YjbR family DNA-binding protein [bacterium]|nr:MmcQ/YjbR family DNA-binding protein [bacterium]
MKKFFIFVVIGLLAICALNVNMAQAKKSGGKGISADDVQTMSDSINKLVGKMYQHALFSPEDNASLINIKLKLDDQMLVSSDPSFAPLYYKLGLLYKNRDMKDEATDCFQTILENFGTTALAPKAAAQLKLMGVTIAPTTGKAVGK